MASIYKRKHERRDPNAKWLITYRDERGERKTIAGCTDKRATEEIARKLEDEIALKRRGVIDATAERIAESARVDIAEHVRAFNEFVKSRKPSGHAARYHQQVEARLNAFIEFAGVKLLPDVDADRLAAYVAAMQTRKCSGFTINEHVGTLKQFTRWAVMTNRLAGDPLAATKKADASKLEKTRQRRALSADEIGRLLSAALKRPVQELKTVRTGKDAGKQVAKVKAAVIAQAEAVGRERVLGYLLALWTGLRRSELAALQWQDVRLDTIPAKLSLRAKTTKAKRADSVALHQQIAGELRKAKPHGTKPTDRVLRRVPSMKVLRADLKAAGIPDETEAGRVDLHAMRMSLATFLAANGVPQRVAQAHMRHSDPRLTAGVYTDETLLPTAAAIAELPPLPTAPAPRPERLRATGTCDPTPGGIAEPAASRAAPAQRAAHTSTLSGASGCTTSGSGGPAAGVAQVHEKTATCAAVQRGSQKRVMGLEPTTFTLAT